jgi:hypothetical protein
MKFVKLLLLALCFSCVLSSNLMGKVKTSKDPTRTFKLAVFGDIGQIDEFEKAVITEKYLNSENYKKIALENRGAEIEKLCVYDNSPVSEKDTCKLKTGGEDLKMTNFEKIKKLLEDEAADQNVLLGDSLYTEAKNMGSYYGTAVDKVKNIINDLKKTGTPELKKALEHMEKSSEFNEKIKHMETPADSKTTKPIERAVAKKFADNVGEDFKKKKEITNSHIDRIQLEYKKRHMCGWKEVDKRFTKLNKDYKLMMSYGNHAYDVDFSLEQFQMSRYSPWRTETKYKFGINEKKEQEEVKDVYDLPVKPKLSYSDSKNVRVWFIDFDMTPLICSDALEEIRTKLNGSEKILTNPKDKTNSKKDFTINKDELFKDDNFEKFSGCLTSRFAHLNPGHFTKEHQMNIYQISYKYYLDLIEALDELKKAKAMWKVARIHQSIFNIERDYLGVKTNKHLMSLFKEAGIHLWLASHHHSAQINFGKYEEKNGYKYLVTKDPVFRFEYNDPIVEENKTKRVVEKEHTDIADFFFTEEKKEDGIDKGCRHLKDKYEGEIDERKTVATINRCQYLVNCRKENIKTKTQSPEGTEEGITLYKSTIKIHPQKTDYIIQLVTGNGGRKLDPLNSDLESDSFLLFGRAYPEEFGYYTLEFTKEKNKNVAFANFKFGPSKSQFKVNYSLKIIQDHNATDFDRNFKEPKFLKEYLNNKYGKYSYENKKCLKKLPFDGY